MKLSNWIDKKQRTPTEAVPSSLSIPIAVTPKMNFRTYGKGGLILIHLLPHTTFPASNGQKAMLPSLLKLYGDSVRLSSWPVAGDATLTAYKTDVLGAETN